MTTRSGMFSTTRAGHYWLASRVVFFFTAIVATPAQYQPPTLRTSVNLVLLDVAVFTKDGKPAVGLTRENFRIVDAGQDRPIARFETGNADLSVAFVVDFSRSMRTRKLAVIQALQRLQKQLSAADEMAVIVFNEETLVLQPPLPSANVDWLAPLIGLAPDGKTAVYDALTQAARLLSRATHSRRICILLSDGVDTASSVSRSTAIDTLRAGNVTAYSVGLFPSDDVEADARFLRRLAAESGGLALFQERPASLDGVLDTILADLRSRYVIGFLTDDPREGRTEVRQVDLTVRDRLGKRLRMRTRKSYQIGGIHGN